MASTLSALAHKCSCCLSKNPPGLHQCLRCWTWIHYGQDGVLEAITQAEQLFMMADKGDTPVGRRRFGASRPRADPIVSTEGFGES